MIREGKSWGGRERNCVLKALPDGGFVDVSAASGADFLVDGRALARVDLDGDERLDLVLRNRNSPSVQLLRNVWPGERRPLLLRLIGERSNRDAVGARVTFVTDRSRKTIEVRAGGAFLSQSSRWISWVAPAGERLLDVRVRWPRRDSEVESFGPLEAGARWRLTESGGATSEAIGPLRKPPPPPADDFAASPRAATERPLVSKPLSAWLVDPLPAPRIPALSADGRRRPTFDVNSGQPSITLLVSTTCAVCLAELPKIERSLRELRGRERIAIHCLSVDIDKEAAQNLGRLNELAPSLEHLQLDADAVLAWNVTWRAIFNRRRDLSVPTSFLLDAQGRIVRVWSGAAQPMRWIESAKNLPVTRAERLAKALPFAGRLLRDSFRRDTLAVGNAFAEAGLTELASTWFLRSSSGERHSIAGTYNAALMAQRRGDLDEARRLYRRVLDENAEQSDALNNLGLIEQQSGRLEEARRHFKQVLQIDPANTEATLNLAETWLEAGEPRQAIASLERALSGDADKPRLHAKLGTARYHAGDRSGAIRELRTAQDLDPLEPQYSVDLAILLLSIGETRAASRTVEAALAQFSDRSDLRNVLGMVRLSEGRTREAIRELELAIRLDPSFDRPWLNLARHHAQSGDLQAARQLLTRARSQFPEHPEIEAFLDELQR